MKLPTRYIKTSKPEKVLINAPVEETEKLIKSANDFRATAEGNVIILKPDGGESVIAVSTKSLANGEATKVKYASALDVLAILTNRALPLLCLIASVTLLLVCILGSMQIGVMWASAAAATLASLIYLVCGKRHAPKKLLLKKFKKHLKQFAEPTEQEV